MKLRVSRRAEQDLIDAYVYGAERFGVQQAEHYQAGLVSTFELLTRTPKAARLRREFTPPVRVHAYQAHLIVYIEDADGILIVRLLHGRRNWERVLA